MILVISRHDGLVETDKNHIPGKAEFWSPIEEKFTRTLGNWRKFVPVQECFNLVYLSL